MKKTYFLIVVVTYVFVLAVIAFFIFKGWFTALLCLLSLICAFAYVCEHARYNVLSERLEHTIELTNEAFEELGKARAHVAMMSHILNDGGKDNEKDKDETTDK